MMQFNMLATILQGLSYSHPQTDRFYYITTLQSDKTREMLQAGIETRLILIQSDILSEDILCIHIFCQNFLFKLDEPDMQDTAGEAEMNS